MPLFKQTRLISAVEYGAAASGTRCVTVAASILDCRCLNR